MVIAKCRKCGHETVVSSAGKLPEWMRGTGTTCRKCGGRADHIEKRDNKIVQWLKRVFA